MSTSARLLLEQAACSTDDRLNWNVNWVRSEIEVCEKVCFFFPLIISPSSFPHFMTVQEQEVKLCLL